MKPFIMAGAGWLAAMVMLSQSGPVGQSPVTFAVGYLLGFALMALSVRLCPPHWPGAKVAAAAVGFGLLGRLCFMWCFPVGNDAYRYIWEGYIQLHGFNPYQMAPDHPQLAHLIQGDMAAIWAAINHKDLSAIYPPLAMLLFRAVAALSPTATAIKSLMLAFDLLTLTALILIVRRHKVPCAHLFWYTLNPLVLVYVAGEAHLDIIQAALLTAGLYAVGTQRPIFGFLSLGAAALSKYFSATALPFVMQRANRAAWPAAAAAGLVLIPFAQASQAMVESLFIFGTRMHYNDGLGEVLRFFVGSAALPALAVLLTGLLAAIYLLEHEQLRSVYLAMGAVLLCLPTLHPWYLLVMAPFMVVYPSRSWLFLMAATVATLPVFVHEFQTGIFQEINWVKWIEYTPFFGLLLFDTLQRRPRYPQVHYPLPQTVTVVMPVLNEAQRIEAAVQAARRHRAVVEVIVVDGDSQDTTPALAREAGAEVCSGPRGRGTQTAIGVDRARGDVVLILHADTRLAPGAVRRMLAALAGAPTIPGGAFEMAFTSPSLKLRWIARLNNWRARWCGIAFGDQGQFIRKAALGEIGGFPDIRLMEDVELSMRMKRFGRPLLVPRGVCVSPRRWQERPFAGNVGRVLTLFLRYLLDRRLNGPEGIRTDYYRKYYRRP